MTFLSCGVRRIGHATSPLNSALLTYTEARASIINNLRIPGLAIAPAHIFGELYDTGGFLCDIREIG